MSEYLAWLQRRRERAEARLAQMEPLTPLSTPLMDMLRRKAATAKAEDEPPTPA